MRRLVLLLLTVLACPVTAADLPILVVAESSFPYEFSPSNYDNSPSNYDNSISNYDNSPSNYDNSSGNYDNSSSNYANGRNGSSRLVLKDGGSTKFVGYYVVASNGTTNFFSLSGDRVFYNPKKGHAVFDGKGGGFCGAIARQQGQLSLVLTERCLRRLLLSD